ncbi:hypothetical protein TcasGA2_TC031937 [Tribolium castaneum]|uniref:Uncharacterized protein n=1 Tax=Tribolium castaneum TaxID=7070 RepID=A0A139WA04_TRICA|nr:hypothetical protein TcasGA2_TC031937 [Tribolium castaneum]
MADSNQPLTLEAIMGAMKTLLAPLSERKIGRLRGPPQRRNPFARGKAQKEEEKLFFFEAELHAGGPLMVRHRGAPPPRQPQRPHLGSSSGFHPDSPPGLRSDSLSGLRPDSPQGLKKIQENGTWFPKRPTSPRRGA